MKLFCCRTNKKKHSVANVGPFSETHTHTETEDMHCWVEARGKRDVAKRGVMKRMGKLFNVLIRYPAVRTQLCSNSNYVCQTCRQILSICSFVCWCHNFWHEMENWFSNIAGNYSGFFRRKIKQIPCASILCKADEFVVVQYTSKVYVWLVCVCAGGGLFYQNLCNFRI